MPNDTNNLRGGLSTNVPMRGENVSFAIERLQAVHNIGLEGPHGTITQSPEMAVRVQQAIAQELRFVRQLQSSGQDTRFENKIQDVYKLVRGIQEMVSRVDISKTPNNAYLDLQATVGGGLQQQRRREEQVRRSEEQAQRLEKQKGIWTQQAQLHVARSIVNSGRTLPSQMKGNFESEFTSLTTDIQGLETKFGTGEGLTPEESRNLSTELTAKSARAASIKQILGITNKEPKRFVPGDLWLQRAQVQTARSSLRNNREVEPQLTKILEGHLTKLDSDVEDLEKKFGTGKGIAPNEARAISTEITSKSNLAIQIKNVLEASSKDQKSGLDKVMGFVSNLTATMAIGTLATHRFITDPFTYGFKPAMNVMGQQGSVGAAFGSAFTQEKQYDIGFNQRYMMLGAGSAVAGVSMMRSATGSMRALGGGMALVGGVVSALSASGEFNNILQRVGITTSKSKIVEQSIAQTVANPQTLLQNFAGSTAGLLASGVGPQFGYYYNKSAQAHRTVMGPNGQQVVGTGNAVLDQFLSNGSHLRGLGYTGAQMGELLSQTSLALRVSSPNQLMGFTGFTGQLAKGYGIGESSAIGMLQTAQRYGSQNAKRSVQFAMGATAENGSVSNFAMSVLVPSLLKVTESLQLKNVARTNKDLEAEVNNLYHSMSNSNTPLGQIFKANPQAFGALVNQIQSGVKMGLENPAVMAYSLSHGSSFGEIWSGKSIVMQRNLLAMANGTSAFKGVDWNTVTPMQLIYTLGGKGGANRGGQVQGVLSALTSVTGINDSQELLNLLIMVKQGDFLNKKTGQLSEPAKAAFNTAKNDINSRVLKIVDSKLGDLNRGIAAQVDAMTNASQSVMTQMQDIQSKLLKYASGDQIIADAKAGIARIVDQINKTLGGTTATAAPTSPALPTSVAAQASGNLSSWIQKAHPAASTVDINKMKQLAQAARTYGTSKPLTDEQFSGIWSRAGFGKSVGGFTGAGSRTDVASVVHAGEYVISDNNVRSNRQLLDRIQSGESIGSSGSSNSKIIDTGGTVYLTMAFDGLSVEDIARIAHKTTADYVVNNKLIY